jgi:MSHA biogenesis protein MshL
LPRALAAAAGICALSGCFQPMRVSEGHLKQESLPPTAGAIPAPVAVTPAIPKPMPVVKPETYSVVVNQVPVQQLLFALARDAKLNIDIYPGLQGNVTINAVDQTLPQILNRLSRQIDMRWEIDGPNLSVMPDSPYLRLYKIDYVNMERDTTETVAVTGQISSGPSGGASGGSAGGTGGANTSSVSIRNTSNNKFWVTLVTNVQDLLHETDKVLPQGTQSVNAALALPPVDQNGAQQGSASSVLADQLAAARLAALPKYREAASVIANPETGVISIRATARQHARVQEFLDQVMASAQREVLLEGTIVEVDLNNNYQQGIDWSAFRTGGAGFKSGQGAVGTSGISNVGTNTLTATPTGSIFAIDYASHNFTAALSLLESFGTVRVLSSPRVTVLNNQTAVLKVVDNLVYFTIQSQLAAATIGTAALATFTTTPNVVPVGFVMNITPQISDNGSVVLNLKPSISRVTSSVQDPNPNLLINGTQIVSKIPQVQTREMESMLRLNDGQVGVMGGLIQDAVQNTEDSIPGLDRIPVLGNAFGNQNKVNTKTELVIFLRPVAIHDASIEGDYKGYRVLMPDDDFLKRENPAKRMFFESSNDHGGDAR